VARFTVQIPERADGGTRDVHARLRGSGKADLYAPRAAVPTSSAYDCRGMNEHSTENCNLNGAEPGKYYVEVFGAKEGLLGRLTHRHVRLRGCVAGPPLG
jgi:hypothetical protein